jgi:subtilisin family serine protease
MKNFSLPLVAALGALACVDSTAPTIPDASVARSPVRIPMRGLVSIGPLVADRYIVVLRTSSTDASSEARQISASYGASVLVVYRRAVRGFAADMSSATAAAMARDPGVAYVEQDRVVSAANTEPLQTGEPWGLDRIDSRAGLDRAYNYSQTGAGVDVYIIDSGIRRTHVEFGNRAIDGFTSIADGNGSNDCYGHGTHVAGTVGGKSYGVAKSARLIAVRVLDCSGNGTVSSVVAGIDWVTRIHARPSVANMSITTGGSKTLDNAVRSSIASGVSYVIAAGNGNKSGVAQDACDYSPGRVSEAMTIGATTLSDAKAPWSNYGRCIDWFAPGTGIAAWIGGDAALASLSGTSVAAPYVSGVAALYLQANPTATPRQVRDALFSATTKGVVTNSSTANNNLLYSPPTGFRAPLFSTNQ